MDVRAALPEDRAPKWGALAMASQDHLYPVHGTIVVHPLCRKIMDTPQFARYMRVDVSDDFNAPHLG